MKRGNLRLYASRGLPTPRSESADFLEQMLAGYDGTRSVGRFLLTTGFLAWETRRMRRARLHAFAGFAAACAAVCSLAPSPAGAGVGDYDYAVERVTIDGGLYGLRDGTPDAIEESF